MCFPLLVIYCNKIQSITAYFIKYFRNMQLSATLSYIYINTHTQIYIYTHTHTHLIQPEDGSKMPKHVACLKKNIILQ